MALNGFESRGIGDVRLTSHIFPSTLDSRATFSLSDSNHEPLFFTPHSTNEPHFSSNRPRTIIAECGSHLKSRVVGVRMDKARSGDKSRSDSYRLTSHFSGSIALDERAIFHMVASIDEPHSFDGLATKGTHDRDYRATFSRLMNHKNLGNLVRSKSIQPYKLKTLCSYKKNKTPSACFFLGGIAQ